MASHYRQRRSKKLLKGLDGEWASLPRSIPRVAFSWTSFKLYGVRLFKRRRMILHHRTVVLADILASSKREGPLIAAQLLPQVDHSCLAVVQRIPRLLLLGLAAHCTPPLRVDNYVALLYSSAAVEVVFAKVACMSCSCQKSLRNIQDIDNDISRRT
jgi:hypothetical protein